MSNRDAYVQKMKAKLDEWNAEIAALEAKARGAQADARVEHEKHIAELRAERDQARARLDKLRAAGDDAWDDLAAGMEKAWRSLSDSVKSARSRFD